MSEQTSQEPTMEEILASIRRIISEDEPSGEAGAEEPAAAAAEAPPAPEPEPQPEPEPVMAEAAPPPAPEPEPEPVVEAAAPPPPAPEPVLEDDDDDALELTQKVETMGDLDVLEPDPVAAAPAPAPRPTLVSEPAALAAATAFGALSAAIAMPRSDRTLEDVVRELLQPLLKQWLDDNLPNIVQQAVEAEVERISRGGVR